MLKQLLFFSLVFLFIFFSACMNSTGNNSLSQKNIEDLNIPDDFDYRTSEDVNVNISVFDNQGQPVPGVTFIVYDVPPESVGNVFAKGVTLDDGTFSQKIKVPLYFENLTVIGLGQTLNLPIVNAEISYEFNGLMSRNFGERDGDWSLFFDGYNDYVTVPDDNSLDLSSNGTLEAWIRITYYQAYAGIIHKGELSDYSDEAYSFQFWDGCCGSGRKRLKLFLTNTSGAYLELSGTTNLNRYQWYHVAATWDASTVKIYLNGILDVSAPNTIGAVMNSPASLQIGAQLQVNSGNSYLQGNIDEVRIWNRTLNQTEIYNQMEIALEGNENGLVAYFRMDEGEGIITYDATQNANNCTIEGATWSTLIISDSDLDGISDMYDDYPDDPTRAFNIFYPAEDIFGTLAFEDLWPNKGDYDFNDLIIDYNFQNVHDPQNKLIEINAEIVVRAIGASYHNGFSIELPFTSAQISSVTGDGTLVTGSSKAIVSLFDDAFDIIPEPTFVFVNTDPDNPYIQPDTLSFKVVLTTSTSLDDLDYLPPYNPFIIVEGNSEYEVHLTDYPPTDFANQNLFGTGDDNSNPAIGRYYKTSNNLPWAVDLPVAWDYPIEKIQITWAHLHFQDWAESGGSLFEDWYLDAGEDYRNDDYIYEP